jgi:menaquinone-dependent protoporphyrinogen oxidase
MKVLVTVASKHGATAGIGEAIAETLRSSDLYVALIEPQRIESVDEFDAVIVGSGIYMGRWLAPARDFVQANAAALSKKPVWLFASGPTPPAVDEGDTADGDRLMALIGARDSKVFPGELKKESLGFVEKQIVRMIKSPFGDYRPWDEIRLWAAKIAEELKAVPVA